MTRRAFAGTVLGFTAAAAAQAGSVEQDAQKIAEAWLALVDQGKYGESWEQAAAGFKKKVPRARWEALAAQARKPLGALKSRSFLSAQFARELPGAPDGEYVVIRYDASYANKKNAVETITPTKDPDGVWRVSGYYIR